MAETEAELTAVMAPILRFIDGFNAADIEAAAAECAEQMAVLDDIPPFEWTGTTTAARWYRDMTVFGDTLGMSEPRVELRAARHVIVDGASAYVVVPIGVTWLEAGAPQARGGTITAALTRRDGTWRISALTWTWE